MSLIMPFVSVIGVIVGFLLGVIRDALQNRPKLKVSLSEGAFNYYKNEMGVMVRSFSGDAEIVEFYILAHVYNIGRADTAIKDISIYISANYETIYQKPELLIDGKKVKHSSFNVKSGTVSTIELQLTIYKDEDNLFIFNEDVSLNPDDKHRLIYNVYLTDIFNKDHKLLIEPLSLMIAE